MQFCCKICATNFEHIYVQISDCCYLLKSVCFECLKEIHPEDKIEKITYERFNAERKIFDVNLVKGQ